MVKWFKDKNEPELHPNIQLILCTNHNPP